MKPLAERAINSMCYLLLRMSYLWAGPVRIAPNMSDFDETVRDEVQIFIEELSKAFNNNDLEILTIVRVMIRTELEELIYLDKSGIIHPYSSFGLIVDEFIRDYLIIDDKNREQIIGMIEDIIEAMKQRQLAKTIHYNISSKTKATGITQEQIEEDVKQIFEEEDE